MSDQDALGNFLHELAISENDRGALVNRHGIESVDDLMRLNVAQSLEGISEGGQKMLATGLECLAASRELTAGSFQFGHLVAFLWPEADSTSEFEGSGNRSPGLDKEQENSTKRRRREHNFARDEEDEPYLGDLQDDQLTESPSLDMIVQCFNRSKAAVSDGGLQDFSLGEDDPYSVVDCAGRHFSKYSCYEMHQDTTNGLRVFKVGIRGFARGSKSSTSFDSAFIVPVVCYSETIAGKEIVPPGDHAGLEADTLDDKYIQLQLDQSLKVHLSKLGDACNEPTELPLWIYEPLKVGNVHNFGYIFDQQRVFGNNRVQCKEILSVADMYSGAGGMRLGYHRAGYKTAVAVDRDEAALQTLKNNLSESEKETMVVQSDVEEFIEAFKRDSKLRNKIGSVDVGHFSTPCQAFSTANRSGGINDEENRKQSWRVPDDVRSLNPRAVVFENVQGMFRSKHNNCLLHVVSRLRNFGYSVRCSLLKACDYGDPQIRPRVFIIAVKKYIPMPNTPVPVYGHGPYVTCEEALREIAHREQLELPLYNHIKGRTPRKEDEDTPRLPAKGAARTLRAGGGRPVHFKEDRLITVREAAALQSFPLDYQFCGTVIEQWSQIGNAVPVQMATAVALSLKPFLMWEYKQDSEEMIRA
jgi:DNA (cytosine-5)-methyltransferase 1